MLKQPQVLSGLSDMSSSMGDLGAGAGKAGGSGGSIRDAGGTFGKLEAAREEEYFNKLKLTQLKQLKDQMKRELEHHEQLVKSHETAAKQEEKRI